MSPKRQVPDGLIWATRGRSWGFRFLLDGGLTDPLPEYERVFAGLGDDPQACSLVGGKVALRFPDPLGRRDAAGRLIPHDFVLSGEIASKVQSIDGGQERVWPLVEAAYAGVWDADHPPAAAELLFTTQDDTQHGARQSDSGNSHAH